MPVYKDKKTGTWYYKINYTTEKGKYAQKKKGGFATKREAQDAEAKAFIELKQKPPEGKPKKVNQNTYRFDDVADAYLRFIEQHAKESSYVTMKPIINLHLKPFFGEKNIHHIEAKDILDWQNYMWEKNYSIGYLQRTYNLLSMIFNYAHIYHGLIENPCSKTRNFNNPDELPRQIQYWTLEEFSTFIKHVKDDILYYTFFSFLYFMGTRKGEALALKWTDINFDTNTVKITKTLSFKVKKEKREQGIKWNITAPKTKNAVREILMPKVLVEHMKAYYEYCKQFEGFNDDCFVFGMFRPLATTTIDRKFAYYIELAGVKKIKIHDLRHSHASLLINNGASILVVSKRLGHKDVSETLNTYAHMFPSKEQEVLDIIDACVVELRLAA